MTTASEREVRGEGYEEWLNRTVNAMPPLTEQQQHELRQLLR